MLEELVEEHEETLTLERLEPSVVEARHDEFSISNLHQHVNVCTCVGVCLHETTDTYACMQMYTKMCVYIYIYVCVCVFPFVYMHTPLLVCFCSCI